LIEALKEEDKMVRYVAVIVLSELGDIRALEPLKQVIEDENEAWLVQGAARTARDNILSRYTPANFTISQVEDSFIQASWDEVDIDKEKYAVSYEIQVSRTSYFGSPLRYYSDTGSKEIEVYEEDTYWIRVCAWADEVQFDWSEKKSVEVDLPPSMPTGFTVPSSDDDGLFGVSWIEAVGADGYELEIADNAEFANSRIEETVNISLDVSVIEEGDYWLRVRAVDEESQSEWSEAKSIKIEFPAEPEVFPPEVPTNFTVPSSDADGILRATWTAVGAAGYEVEIADNEQFTNSKVEPAADTGLDIILDQEGDYWLRVRSVEGELVSAWSEAKKIEVNFPPDAPTGFVVPSSDDDGAFGVSWTAAVNATGYEVEIADSLEFASSRVEEVIGTDLDVSLTEEGDYWLRVRAVEGETLASDWSEAKKIAVNFPPVIPTGFTVPASDDDGLFGVSWIEVSGATGYKVEIADNAEFTNSKVEETINANLDLTLTEEGDYWLRVRAVEEETLVSGWSEAKKITVNFPPERPTSFTVPLSDDDGIFSVSWIAAESATGYEVEIADNLEFADSRVEETISMGLDVILDQEGDYWLRVRAVDGDLHSEWSEAKSIKIEFLVEDFPPVVPTGFTVPSSDDNGVFGVSWTEVTDAAGYEVEIADNSEFTNSRIEETINTSLDVTLAEEGDYWLRVRAVDGDLVSEWSGVESIKIEFPAEPEELSPDSPANFTVPSSDSDGVFRATWTAVGASGYEVEIADNAEFEGASLEETTSAGLDVTLTEEGEYWLRVRAVEGELGSEWSEAKKIEVNFPPEVPMDFTLPAFDNDGVFGVSWIAAASATGYEVEIANNEWFLNSKVEKATGTELDVAVTEEGGYWLRVRAVEGELASEWSEAKSIKIEFLVEDLPPAVPTGFTVPSSDDNGLFGVSWVAASGAAGYEVEIADNAEFANSRIEKTINTSLDVTLAEEGDYWLRVRAVDGDLVSEWSEAKSIKIEFPDDPEDYPPDIPTDFSVPSSDDDGAFRATWTAAGATGYEVEIADNAELEGARLEETASAGLDVTLTEEGEYWLRVRSVEGELTSEWSEVQKIEINFSPAVPAGFTLPSSDDDGVFKAVWTEVTDVVDYEVEIANNEWFLSSRIEPARGTKLDVVVIEEGGYWLRVRAVEGDLRSEWSEAKSIKIEFLVDFGPSSALDDINNPLGCFINEAASF